MIFKETYVIVKAGTKGWVLQIVEENVVFSDNTWKDEQAGV